MKNEKKKKKILLSQEKRVDLWLKHLYENIVLQPMDCLKVSIPSFIYVIQNNLLYIAVSNLEAATFQVIIVVKLITCTVSPPFAYLMHSDLVHTF